MFYRPPLDIRVCVDVGSKSHQVAVGLSTGELIDEFCIRHHPDGFRTFFAKLEQLEQQYQCPVRVAMEGYNGYARPLDSMVLARGWQLNNINNLKLARFKEIFPGAAKTDAIDAHLRPPLLTKQLRFAIASCATIFLADFPLIAYF